MNKYREYSHQLNAIPSIEAQIEIENWVTDEKGKILESLTNIQRLNLREEIFDSIYDSAIRKIEELERSKGNEMQRL